MKYFVSLHEESNEVLVQSRQYVGLGIELGTLDVSSPLTDGLVKTWLTIRLRQLGLPDRVATVVYLDQTNGFPDNPELASEQDP